MTIVSLLCLYTLGEAMASRGSVLGQSQQLDDSLSFRLPQNCLALIRFCRETMIGNLRRKKGTVTRRA